MEQMSKAEWLKRPEVINFIVAKRRESADIPQRQIAEEATERFDVRFTQAEVSRVLRLSGMRTNKSYKKRTKRRGRRAVITEQVRSAPKTKLSGFALFELLCSTDLDIKTAFEIAARTVSK